MLDPSSESRHSTYSRGDDSARSLWGLQRRKANPWEHRGENPEEPDTPAPATEAPAQESTAPEEAATPRRIRQTDTLVLQQPPELSNPFESLLKRRSPHSRHT